MSPNQLAKQLRDIASAIDNSKRPDRKAVIAAVSRVAEELQAPQAQVALPQSGPGKNMLKKMLSDAQAALESGDDAGFKGLLEKLMKNA